MATSYTAEAVGNLLKTYYEDNPSVTKQFFDDNQLLKRIERNKRDILGGTAACGLHAGRNSGVGAAANGGQYGTPGRQTVYQTTIPLKYNYMPTILSGPDIENSKGNAAAFVSALTLNMDGAIADGKRDLSRQLFADGSGVLALAAADASTVTQTIYPYLWSDPTQYLPAGRELQIYSITDGSTSKLTADARATASVVSSVTAAGGVASAIVAAVDRTATSAAGDAIGPYGALQVANATSFTQIEAMGLWGLVHNTDLLGSTAYKYDAGDDGNTAVVNFTNAEGAAADWAGPTSASNTNTVQGLATASYSWWKSLCFGNGGVPRALSFDLIDRMVNRLRSERGSKLSAIYTTWQAKQKLVNLIRTDRRYVDTVEVDGALKVAAYDGVPIFVSQDCPRGTMFFLDESEFVFYDKKGFHFLKDDKGSNMFKVSQQDLYEITGATYSNLGCRSRWRQGKIFDILESN